MQYDIVSYCFIHKLTFNSTVVPMVTTSTHNTSVPAAFEGPSLQGVFPVVHS